MIAHVLWVSGQGFGFALLGFFQVIITALIGAWVAMQANRKEKINTAEAAQRAILEDKDKLFDERLEFKDEIIRQRTMERDEAYSRIEDQKAHIHELRKLLLEADNNRQGGSK